MAQLKIEIQDCDLLKVAKHIALVSSGYEGEITKVKNELMRTQITLQEEIHNEIHASNMLRELIIKCKDPVMTKKLFEIRSILTRNPNEKN